MTPLINGNKNVHNRSNYQSIKKGVVCSLLFFGFFFASTSHVHADITTGLVGWWTFDGQNTHWTSSSSATTDDLSGNGNTGTLENMNQASSTVTGKIGGQALYFNGNPQNQYVLIGGTEQYAATSSPFTASAWVNPNSFVNLVPTIINLRTNTNYSLSIVLSEDGSPGPGSYLGISMGSGDTWASISTGASPAGLIGSWHHIVVVYNGQGAGTISNYAIYLDGVSQTVYAGGDYGGIAQETTIGTCAAISVCYWDGAIDDVRVYNRSLSANDVTQLYNYSGFVPLVTSPTTSSSGPTTVTLIATTTSDGATSTFQEGFNYGTTTAYGLFASSTGSFNDGSFSQTIGGLTCNTTYHAQAFAINTTGTGTSSDYLFSTQGCIATAYTLSGPTSGNQNSASSIFSVTPNNPYTGIITITPTGGGSAGLSPITLSFSNSDAPQTFTITPTAVGSITLTPTNNGGLPNPSVLTYVSNAVAAPTVTYAGEGGGTASAAELATLLAPGPATTAYLNSLKGMGYGTASSTTAVPLFTRYLKIGMSGYDVKTLQVYLNTHGSILASSGPGSLGHETDMFGSLTKAALIRFQLAHSLPGTGYFGPMTKNYVSARL